MTDLVARLKLQFDKAEMGKMIGKSTVPEIGGRGKDTKNALNSGFGKMMMPLVSIAGGIGLLVSSSKMLQGVLGNVYKSIGRVIRPIGDVFGAALLPLISILRPIGVFFNILMKPYIQKAMAAMRAGEALLYAGDTAGAMGAFALGESYLLKPFADMFTTVIFQMGEGVYTLVGKILEMNPLTYLAGVAIETMGSKMSESAAKMNDASTNILDVQLGNLLARTEEMTGKHMSGMVKSLADADITLAFLSSALSMNMSSPFSDLNTWIVNDWGTEFTAQVKKIFDAATVAHLYTPPTGGGGAAANNIFIPTLTNVMDSFTGNLTTITNTIAAAIGSSYWNSNLLLPTSGFQHGGTVAETGLYTLHKGETVTTPGATSGQGVSVTFNPTYNISSSRSPDEIRRVVESIAESKYRELVSEIGGR